MPNPPLLPCNGSRVGEVMLVFPDYAMASVVTPQSVSPIERCSTEMNGYLGQPGSGTQPGVWAPSLPVRLELVFPDRRQRAADQRWAACVVSAFDFSGGNMPFKGSARDVMLRPGADSAALSTCLDGRERTVVNCLTPHHTELFATMTVLPGITDAELRSSCLDLVTGLTLMRDPTAAGALTVIGAMETSDERYTDAGVASCAVTVTDPERALTSTLRNLGNAPLPLK